jgi:hypothetical protein
MEKQGTNNRAMTNFDKGKKNGERGTKRTREQQ